MSADALSVSVWSDPICPWCYVGKRRLDQALDQFEYASNVQVTWRSFELDPAAPKLHGTEQSYAERLATKYRTSTAQAELMIRRMAQVGARSGIEFRFDIVRPGNTFDAHRLLHWAKLQALQGSLEERLFRAYFCEGQALGDASVLARLADEVGLGAEAASAVLASDDHAVDVRSDEAVAQRMGVRGVPFFLIGRFGVSGAQPTGDLLELLERAWNERDQPSQEPPLAI